MKRIVPNITYGVQTRSNCDDCWVHGRGCRGDPQIFGMAAEYMTAGDWQSWAAMYAEDGLLQPPNTPTVRGREALVAWGQAFPPIKKLRFFDVEVFGHGDLAYRTSSYTLELHDPPTDRGVQLFVMTRDEKGVWRPTAGSFASDLPLPD